MNEGNLMQPFDWPKSSAIVPKPVSHNLVSETKSHNRRKLRERDAALASLLSGAQVPSI